MAVNVTVLDEGNGVMESFDVIDYPSAEALSKHLMFLHLNKVEIASDEQVTYTGMMEPGKVQALSRLLLNKEQDKAWFAAYASMKCGTFKAEKDSVDVLLYAKTKAPSPPQPPSLGLLPVSPPQHRYGGQVIKGIGAPAGTSSGKATIPTSKIVTPPGRSSHEDSLQDSVDEGMEEEKSEVSDEEEDDEPHAKRAAAGAGAGSLGKRSARITLRGHARGLVAASPRMHGQTRVEEDGEKDDDGIFAKKRGRRASDNAPKSKGVSKGQDQGQKKSLKKGQVQGKEDAQEEGEEEGQEKEEEEGNEKGKGKGKKKEGNEVNDSKESSHNAFGGDEDGKKAFKCVMSVAADQPSDEAEAPSLTVPPVMVEQLQTMLGSMAPGFMRAYGVQEATVMTSIQGVLDTKLHKFQVSELVLCLWGLPAVI
ncbi:hypothetical protein V8C86DRAFT_2446493 [Haematococcus lacustris]